LKRSLREILSEALPKEELAHIYNSYDIMGDIAIIRVTEASKKYWPIVAATVMGIHKNVKTVLVQTGPIHGNFRLRRLEYVSGEYKTATVHKESGCLFSVDVEKCYFSPRLLHERMRIANNVRSGEVIVNMFAGVGCFSIVIAKHSNAEKVYSVDVNPTAIRFMQDNVRLNRVYGKVIPMLGDAKEVVKERLCNVADRVIMPLPEKAFEYLPYALLSLKKAGGWIHYYDFEHAKKNENPVKKIEAKLAEKLESLGVDMEIPLSRVVRTTGPNWYQIVLDVKVRNGRNKRNNEDV